MTFRIRIIPGSPSPIYRQIVEQVRWASSAGTLPAGAQLPSVRALSEELVVNPNTIAKAYAILCQEGTVEARAGRGVFVSDQTPRIPSPERRARFVAAADQFLREAITLSYSSEQIHRGLDERMVVLGGSATPAERKKEGEK